MHSNIYRNLESQFNKIFSHNRQGSYRTKHRYAEAFKRFLVFLAETFRLEKLANIAPKHIYAYMDKLAKGGKSVVYVKTELAAIRFWHDQIPNPRFKYLPDNKSLNLARRKYGGVDRTWSGREFNLALVKAMETGHEDYAAILCLARYAALRLHECFRLDTQTAEAALKTGILTVRGKGGLIRTVPINMTIEIELKKMLTVTPRGHKLFVQQDDKTHLTMHRFESFISRHKTDIQDLGSTRPMSFHGLRHTCAAEWYKSYIDAGDSEFEARKKVSKLLGHNRDEVTKIYLASLDEENKADETDDAKKEAEQMENENGQVVNDNEPHV